MDSFDRTREEGIHTIYKPISMLPLFRPDPPCLDLELCAIALPSCVIGIGTQTRTMLAVYFIRDRLRSLRLMGHTGVIACAHCREDVVECFILAERTKTGAKLCRHGRKLFPFSLLFSLYFSASFRLHIYVQAVHANVDILWA